MNLYSKKPYHQIVLLAVGMCFIVGLSVLSFILFGNDSDEHSFINEIKNEDVVTSSLSTSTDFVLERYFPNTGNFAIRTDSKVVNQFLIRNGSELSLIDNTDKILEGIDIEELLPGSTLGDYVLVGDNILLSNGSGISVYNLVNKTLQSYTENDGLVSHLNIRLHPDPINKNIVWIGTFEGLSQFDLQNRTFVNYASEIGIPGTKWEPRVMYIDEKEVWVTIGANAYNPGGVARFNKESRVWQSWSTETFAIDTINDRVDPSYASVGNPDYIIIEEDNSDFIYNRTMDQWSILRRGTQQDAGRQGKAIIDGWYYYTQNDSLYGYNIKTKELTTIDYRSNFTKKVSNQNNELISLNFMFDIDHQRFIVYAEQSHLSKVPYIYTFTTLNGNIKDETLYSINKYFEKFQYLDVQILDVASSTMLMKVDQKVVLYDFNSFIPLQEWNRNTILMGGWDIRAKIYPNYIAFHVADYCEGMCLKNVGYTSTTTVVTRNSNAVVFRSMFATTTEGWSMQWDDSQVLGRLQNYYSSSSYEISVDIPEFVLKITDSKLLSPYTPPGSYKSLRGNDSITYLARPGVNDSKDILKIKTNSLNGKDQLHEVLLLSNITNFDGAPVSFEVIKSNWLSPYAWFLTNRGLVRFKYQTFGVKIFTATDGVRVKYTTNTWHYDEIYTADKLIIADSLGVGIYRYPID